MEYSKPDTNLFLDYFVEGKYRWHRHFLLLIFFALVIITSKIDLVSPAGAYAKMAGFCFLVLVFYTNMYWLVPRLLFKGGYKRYAIGVGIYIAATYFMVKVVKHRLEPYLTVHDPESIRSWSVFLVIFYIGMIMSASTSVKLFQRWVLDSRRIIELERATMQSELERLKNQINPHFLFNMLNNANVLVHKDPDMASQVLMKLSDLLRYQLYDSVRSKVLLTADIHFLTDYLNLEKVRRDRFDFIVSKEGEINGVQIPPLLFILFVENAVKHSMDVAKCSYVHVSFSVENSKIFFVCSNSKSDKPPVKNGSGGLGLVNARKRLELLYADRYELAIEDKICHYSVRLTIKL